MSDLTRAADRLDRVAAMLESNGARSALHRPTAALLRAVAETHCHYPQCECAEYVTGVALATAVLSEVEA